MSRPATAGTTSGSSSVGSAVFGTTTRVRKAATPRKSIGVGYVALGPSPYISAIRGETYLLQEKIEQQQKQIDHLLKVNAGLTRTLATQKQKELESLVFQDPLARMAFLFGGDVELLRQLGPDEYAKVLLRAFD
jgi:hypothetical protein